MKASHMFVAAAAAATMLHACSGGSGPAEVANVLLEKWTGPYGGVPPFDRVEVGDMQPALEKAMALALDEMDAITAADGPATFENTIAALERSGAELDRAATVYYVWSSTMSTEEFREVEAEMEPKLAAFRDKIHQNAALFERVAEVYENRDALTPEQQRLTWDYYTDFVRAGAKLSNEEKERIGAINQRLATLYTDFSNNLLHDEEAYVLYLDESQLSGLPQSVIDAAGAAAERKGQAGKYAILNTRSSMDPFLTYSDDRGLREKVWRTYYSRGDNGDEHDNNELITEILKLRAERSKLQGYETFAHRALEKQVAKTPEAAIELMEKVWPAAVARVKEEVADMRAVAGHDIEPWDYRYYAEKVRKAKYDLDADEVKQYLQLEKLREAMFWASGKLYGLEYRPVENVPVYHSDVRVWEVTKGGAHVGLWYFDPYAREGKRSGAWMNDYRAQERMDDDVTTIVSNNSNFVKGAPGEPVLISWTTPRRCSTSLATRCTA